MPITWIIAADETRARVLEAHSKDRRDLAEIEDLVNPTGRLQERELQSDAEPRFSGHGGVASDREAQGAVEQSAKTFARELGRYLEKARGDQRYDMLVLAAPPKFLGALRKALGKEVEKLIVDEIPKEISGLPPQELVTYLGENLRTP